MKSLPLSRERTLFSFHTMHFKSGTTRHVPMDAVKERSLLLVHFVTKDEYANTMRAYQKRDIDMMTPKHSDKPTKSKKWKVVCSVNIEI